VNLYKVQTNKLSVLYIGFQLLVVRWYFRVVSPQNLSSYHSGGEDVPEHYWYIR